MTTNTNWRKIFKDWKSSKLSQKAYCKKHDIKYSSFKLNRYKNRLRPKKKSESKLLPISILAPKSSSLLPSLTIILPSNITLSFNQDISVEVVKSLLVELEVLK